MPIPAWQGDEGAQPDGAVEQGGGMARALSEVRTPAEAAPVSGDASLTDVWKLLAMCLPPRAPSLEALSHIAVPAGIAQDSRRRMAFRAGVLAARELGLDAGGFSPDVLIALGRETITDHVMSGTAAGVLVVVARLEGKVDDGAWAAGDKDEIARQVAAFLRAEFQAEIDLHQALEALSTEPPLRGRQELADALLREHDIDPDAVLAVGYSGALDDVSSSSPALVRDWKAGEFYFNRDSLDAGFVRNMKTLEGKTPTPAQIRRLLAALPVSLDAEFGRRFDTHKQRMSALLAKWLSARLSLHAKEASIDLASATVTISRAHMRYFTRAMGVRPSDSVKFSDSYGTAVSHGFLVSIEVAGATQRCFISTRTGQVHALPAGGSVDAWLREKRDLVFDEGAARARLGARPGVWMPRVHIQDLTSGPYASIRERSADVFAAEIEHVREAARGQTWSEDAVDTLLNLIPFRAMVVELRKGNISMAVLHGGVDVLSLLPLIGTGARLVGAAARSATPWLSLGLRFGGAAAGRAGAGGLRRLAGRIPLARDYIRNGMSGAAIRGLGRLRPLDIRRIAQALRATTPGLADILERIAARARAPAIPDGVWRVHGAAMASPTASGAIHPMSPVIARSLQGGKLRLLPYGERAGAYTQVTTAGRRVGALLVADSEGWLHQTMPVASLGRYRVDAPDSIRVLEKGRRAADGTVVINGVHYARLGSDYVEVTRDMAWSTPGRPIWRVAAPAGAVPDVVVHRLVYDRVHGLWRQADAVGLAGGGAVQGRLGLRGGARIAAASSREVRVAPDAAQLAAFRDALVLSMRDATPEQAGALRALLDRIAGDRRGKAILNAFSAYYDLLGEVPEIALVGAAGTAGARPSLDRPVPGKLWRLDLDALRFGSTEAVIQELAAVYNNMTGVLQNDGPFDDMLARNDPPIDARLEQAWVDWIAGNSHGGQRGPDALTTETALTQREATVLYLRGQIREMRCYGGLDKSTFKAVLRNQRGRWDMKLNLSHRGLDSIPPLPRDTRVLNVSNNPIRNWSALPDGLTVLDAEATGLSALPANLPPGLLELNVSGNRLGRASLVFPAGLLRLGLGGNRLTVVPALPKDLKELVLQENSLEALPHGLPRGLELLDVSNNVLTRLPDDLPPAMRVLHAEHNRLDQLPSLPAWLEELDVSWNRLRSLGELPRWLRILEAGNNILETLPGNLSPRLEVLIAPRNRLTRLPDDLPNRLSLLAVQLNAIEELPGNIADLEHCSIHLDGNPLAPGAVPLIVVGSAGPRIFFDDSANAVAQRARTVGGAVRYWWSRPSVDAQARWDAIDQALGRRADAMEFALVLDRLRTTVSYRDPAFRAQVEAWLVDLSRPERRSLFDETLALCQGASETCEDGLISIWNDVQMLRANDDVRAGLFDDRVQEVVETARQIFRIDALTAFARRHERERVVIDPVELYLAYAVRLRDVLGLTMVAPMMRFYDLSSVTAHDLCKARDTVQALERAEFDRFLVLDYEPWQTLLKRKDAKAYAEAEQAAHRDLDAKFTGELDKELAKLGLDPENAAARADAEKDLGPGIMRQIRYEAMAPLTRALRRELHSS
ncbi:NEL domain-containing protein [Bordetella sputigena]